MITKKEIIGNYVIEDEFILENIDKLLWRLNKFRELYGKSMIVTSGFRSIEHNKKIGGSKNSRHCLGMAADFRDDNGEIREWAMENPHVLDICDLYMEEMDKVPRIHLDFHERKNRIFKP